MGDSNSYRIYVKAKGKDGREMLFVGNVKDGLLYRDESSNFIPGGLVRKIDSSDFVKYISDVLLNCASNFSEILSINVEEIPDEKCGK